MSKININGKDCTAYYGDHQPVSVKLGSTHLYGAEEQTKTGSTTVFENTYNGNGAKQLTLTGSNMSGATEGWTSCFNPTTDISHVEFGSEYSYTAPNNKDIFFMVPNTSDTGGAYLDYDVSTDTFTVTNTSQTPATVNQLGWKIKESLVTTVEPYCYIQDTATYTSEDGLKPFLIIAYKDASQNTNYNSSNMNVWFFGYDTVDITTSTSRVVAGKCTEGATYTDHEYIKDGIHYLVYPVCKGNQYNTSFASGSPCTRIGLVTYNLPQGESVWIKGLRFSFVNLPVTVSELTSNFVMTDDSSSHTARSASATEMFVERAMDLGYKYEDYTGGLPAPSADYPLTETVETNSGNLITKDCFSTRIKSFNEVETATGAIYYDEDEDMFWVNKTSSSGGVQITVATFNPYYPTDTWAHKPLVMCDENGITLFAVGLTSGMKAGIETSPTESSATGSTVRTSRVIYGYENLATESQTSDAWAITTDVSNEIVKNGYRWYMAICNNSANKNLRYLALSISGETTAGIWKWKNPVLKAHYITWDELYDVTGYDGRGVTTSNLILRNTTVTGSLGNALLEYAEATDFLTPAPVLDTCDTSTVTLTKPEQKADFVSGKILDSGSTTGADAFPLTETFTNLAPQTITTDWGRLRLSGNATYTKWTCDDDKLSCVDTGTSAISPEYDMQFDYHVTDIPWVSSYTNWRDNYTTKPIVIFSFEEASEWTDDVSSSTANFITDFYSNARICRKQVAGSSGYWSTQNITYQHKGRTYIIYGMCGDSNVGSDPDLSYINRINFWIYQRTNPDIYIKKPSLIFTTTEVTIGDSDVKDSNAYLLSSKIEEIIEERETLGLPLYEPFTGGEPAPNATYNSDGTLHDSTYDVGVYGTCDTLETFYPTTTVVGGDETKTLLVSETED